jgi:Flp pilus assembly pilin Flp
VRGIVPKASPTDHMTMRALKFWRREDGQTMAEYGVILAVITPAIVAVIALMSSSIADVIGQVATLL